MSTKERSSISFGSRYSTAEYLASRVDEDMWACCGSFQGIADMVFDEVLCSMGDLDKEHTIDCDVSTLKVVLMDDARNRFMYGQGVSQSLLAEMHHLGCFSSMTIEDVMVKGSLNNEDTSTALKWALRGGNPNIEDKDGHTLLDWFVHSNDVDGVKSLLDVSNCRIPVDVNKASNSRLRTPLYGSENLEIIELLVDAGSNVNAEDIDHSTPLHCIDNQDVAMLLISLGANMHAQDIMGNSPSQVGHPHTTAVIERLVMTAAVAAHGLASETKGRKM